MADVTGDLLLALVAALPTCQHEDHKGAPVPATGVGKGAVVEVIAGFAATYERHFCDAHAPASMRPYPYADALRAAVTWRDTAVGTAAVLRFARVFLVRGWCQKAVARDHHGEPTTAGSPSALRWSLSGAVQAAADSLQRPAEGSEVIDLLRHASGEALLFAWNDDPARTAEEVLALVDQVLGEIAPAMNRASFPFQGSILRPATPMDQSRPACSPPPDPYGVLEGFNECRHTYASFPGDQCDSQETAWPDYACPVDACEISAACCNRATGPERIETLSGLTRLAAILGRPCALGRGDAGPDAVIREADGSSTYYCDDTYRSSLKVAVRDLIRREDLSGPKKRRLRRLLADLRRGKP